MLSFIIFLNINEIIAQDKKDKLNNETPEERIDKYLREINRIILNIEEINKSESVRKEERISNSSGKNEPDQIIENKEIPEKIKKVKIKGRIKEVPDYKIEFEAVKSFTLKLENQKTDIYKLFIDNFGLSSIDELPDYNFVHKKVKHITAGSDETVKDFFKFVVHKDFDLRESASNQFYLSSSIKVDNPTSRSLMIYEWEPGRYKWKFKFDKNIFISSEPVIFFEIRGRTTARTIGTSSINSEVAGYPLFSLIAVKSGNRDVLQFNRKIYKNISGSVLAEESLDDFAGIWLTAELTLFFSENGYYKLEIKDMNENVLMFCERNFDKVLYEKSYDYFYPVWGIKRFFTDKRNLVNKEEAIFFTDFTIEKLRKKELKF